MRLIIILLLMILPILALAQTGEMLPFLQTPTSTSMYVCWKTATGTETILQYGTTSSLGSTITGGSLVVNSSITWHWAKLINLSPVTRYYYKCVTGSQLSVLNSFTTAPTVATTDGHLRIIMMGDTRTNTSDVVNLVTNIQAKLQELYGPDWRQKINLLCHVGDSANSYTNPSSFLTECLVPFSPLSSSIPIMITPGNHEAESPNFYNFMKTEDFQGPEGKKYYSFDLADARFLYMNSNTQGTTQSNWIQTKLSEAQADASLDFVFGILHHHGHSEFQPSQNTSWVQNTVVPALASITKPTMLSYGHAHCYERGIQPNTRTRLLLCGAGGAPLEDWGDTDQTNYPEVNIALNWWSYVIVDIDLAAHTYTAKMFTTGNTLIHPGNIQYDAWSQSVAPVIYNASAISNFVGTNGVVDLVSAPAQNYGGFDLISSQFQVSTNSAFSSTIVDVSRNWMDVYETMGSPSYTPHNWNAGIDLLSYSLNNGVLTANSTYYWRVRYRSQNGDWGPWTTARQFIDAAAPSAPVVSITHSATGPKLQWAAVAGITYYKIWATTDLSNPNSWILLQTVTGTSYIYTGMIRYQFFRVTSSTTAL